MPWGSSCPTSNRITKIIKSNAETTLTINTQAQYIHIGYQANYINALAISVLPFFEPAKPITLGELFVTLGDFFLTLGEPFFSFSFIFNVMIGGEYF
jgi:hypothetical protein